MSEQRQVGVPEGLGEPEQVDQAMQNKQCCDDDPDHGILQFISNVGNDWCRDDAEVAVALCWPFGHES